jgi:hypothetical protein
MALVGNVYIQASSSDPGSVGFGYQWAQTDTGNLYARNTANSGWNLIGNANQASLGDLPLSGGAMTGAITGAHGLMPLAGGNFLAMPTAQQGSQVLPLVTQSYVDQRDQYVLSQISPQVQQALASQQVVSIHANMSIAWGVTTTGLTPHDGGTAWASPPTSPPSTLQVVIPSFTYADGSSPAVSEMSVMTSLASAIGFVGPNGGTAIECVGGGSMTGYTLYCPSPTTNPLAWVAGFQTTSSSLWYGSPINYMVIAVKTGA